MNEKTRTDLTFAGFRETFREYFERPNVRRFVDQDMRLRSESNQLEGPPDRNVWTTGRSVYRGEEYIPMSNLIVKTRDGQTVDLKQRDNLRRGMVFRAYGRKLVYTETVSLRGVAMRDAVRGGTVVDTDWPCYFRDCLQGSPEAACSRIRPTSNGLVVEPSKVLV